MIIDDNSQEIKVRKVDFITLDENKIIFHMKDNSGKRVKTYGSISQAKEDFEKVSQRIENYLLVKSGKPLNGL